jgi:hypothetical protein
MRNNEKPRRNAKDAYLATPLSRGSKHVRAGTFPFTSGERFAYIEGMTLETIKDAIAELPRDEKARLAAWLFQQDMEEWDRQIEEDFSPGGNGMALLEEAEADVREGRAKPMDEFLAEAKFRRNPPKS